MTRSSEQGYSYKSLFQLLKFSGMVSGQKLFKEENKDWIATRSEKLCKARQVKGGNTGGTDQKTLKELWLELHEDKHKEYDQRALDVKQDLFAYVIAFALWVQD